MSNKENYKKLFLEKVNENLKLKQEIEICQKKLELSKSLNNSFDFFDKCYNPLRNEYKFVYQRLEYLFTRVQELKNIYNQRLLLNPNFSNIKIRDEEKMKIINETRIVLNKCQIETIPPLKDFYVNKPEGNFLAAYERTKNRKIVVKKQH